MTPLHMRLYFDEDIDVSLAGPLRGRDFDVQTTLEAKRLTSSDDDQLQYATASDRVLVTHNRRDFEELAKLYIERGQSHAGIIILIRRPIHRMTARLLRVLNHVAADEMVDQLRYI